MTINSRTKGKRGEREVVALIKQELGIAVERNLQQSRGGGADIDKDVGGFLIEVKFREQLQLNQWWQQAVAQARMANKNPCLFYRQARKPWRVVIRLYDLWFEIADEQFIYKQQSIDNDSFDMTIEMSTEAFFNFLREANLVHND